MSQIGVPEPDYVCWLSGQGNGICALHKDQFIHPPKSQGHWYGVHSGFDPAAATRPGGYISHWENDAATLNTMNAWITKATGTASTPSC